MRFSKLLFLTAGIYGLLVLMPQYFMEQRNGLDYPPAINHPEYYYGFVGIAVAWQVLFIILSRDPLRYRAMMIPAVLEKASFGLAAIVLYMQHRIAALLLGFGIIDLILGALFAAAFVKTANSDEAS